ncbi:hypothetical protein ACFL6U_18060 [Planctomycetota bacterium]
MKVSCRLTSFLLFMLLLAGLLTMGGCGLQTRGPASNQAFLLDVQSETGQGDTQGKTLQLRNCRALAPFAGKNLIYRVSDVRYEQDFYNGFLAAPDQQIDISLHQWLQQRGYNLISQGAESSIGVLQPTLERLLADFTDPDQSWARVQMRFVLTELSSQERTPVVLLDERWTVREPLPSPSRADDVVMAQSRCLEQIFSQLDAVLANLYNGASAEPD